MSGREMFKISEQFSWPSQSLCKSSVRLLEIGAHCAVQNDDALGDQR